MKYVRIRYNSKSHFGLLENSSIRLCSGAASMEDLFAGAWEPGEAVEAEGVEYLTPVPNPGKIICVGLNYRKHAEEGGNPIPDYPAIFLRVVTSLCEHGGAIVRPKVSDKLDYEAELAIVIGKTAKGVTAEQALEHVGGYSCFNDGSLRDYQRKSTQWTMGKNFDRTGAFGPAIVTPDELPIGASGLRIVSRVNGQIMQDSDTADMIFDVATIVSLLSEVMTLEVGDVIATGTPAGVGYARKPPYFLKAGDRCEVEIEGIGTLVNDIEDA